MIKPEGLRIGNFVRISSDSCMIPKWALCEVVAIDSERACEDKKGLVGLLQIVREEWEFSHGVWCDGIEGIPINKEFLVKNGFGEVKRRIGEDGFESYHYENEDSLTEVWYYPEQDKYFAYCFGMELCDISFVHELQNIIAAVKDDIKITI